VSEALDLKQLERRAHRESLQDGIMKILLGFLLAVCGLMTVDPRMAGGFAVGSLRLPGKMDSIAVYLICMGVLLAAVGAVMLVRFLRSYPIAPQEAADDQHEG